uniref:(northern house mosquito) hypothetical protein n=1 Tax=Culex pipiens TaxID=7175 RepID=A0A8D8DYU8_CULPI
MSASIVGRSSLVNIGWVCTRNVTSRRTILRSNQSWSKSFNQHHRKPKINHLLLAAIQSRKSTNASIVKRFLPGNVATNSTKSSAKSCDHLKPTNRKPKKPTPPPKSLIRPTLSAPSARRSSSRELASGTT